MHFGPTAAQDRLRDRVRAFLGEISPPAEVRRLMDSETGFDPEAWGRLTEEMRLTGVHLPQRLGGAGLGWVDLGVVVEETGRVLLTGPFLSTVTAAAVLAAAGGQDDLVASLAAGRSAATLAVAEAAGRWDGPAIATRAVRSSAAGWRLEGEKSYVVDGCVADTMVVAARPEDGDVGLFVVDALAAGVSRAPLATVDLTRRQARVRLAAVPARPLGDRVPLARAMELAVVALAAEQVGAADRALEMAVAHARSRVQFGRPIGSFQAVKHLCADMLLELECARSAAFYAADAADRAPGELPAAAAVAKSCCSEAFVRIATDSLHVHGGLGFTWDHDAHLYFKRARSSALLFGDPRHHRELLAHHLGL